jgi:hypothetical protein
MVLFLEMTSLSMSLVIRRSSLRNPEEITEKRQAANGIWYAEYDLSDNIRQLCNCKIVSATYTFHTDNDIINPLYGSKVSPLVGTIIFQVLTYPISFINKNPTVATTFCNI